MSFELPLDQMSVAEKVAAMEAIWASLCNRPVDVTSPAWHDKILSERSKRIESGEATLTDWSEAKERLQNLGK
ncbi:MAG: addiction module protein [Planctomycetales bacterium]|nr:addiction module protein [Planctomycetales bacterium]